MGHWKFEVGIPPKEIDILLARWGKAEKLTDEELTKLLNWIDEDLDSRRPSQ